MKYLLKEGIVVDAKANSAKKLDILIEGSKITAVSENLDCSGLEVLCLEGCYIFPGFVDMHLSLIHI